MLDFASPSKSLGKYCWLLNKVEVVLVSDILEFKACQPLYGISISALEVEIHCHYRKNNFMLHRIHI